MAAVWTCQDATCGRTVETKTTTCPKCGGPVRKVGDAPWRGWLGLLCGLFLIGMMGAIIWNLGPALRETIATGSSVGFTGTAEQAQAILYLFYTIIAFGVLALVNGIYMIVTGSQHRIFIILTVLMAALLVFTVYLAVKDIK
ncbi:hypothetical protein RCO27_07225 [Sphingosinicella sp. LHD-64]|uniref:hypothetical protein n=1 Tax=Sphingosinicella sp. LHD-64 TaxID=3072139 RepID=UPI00280D5198|nr:hypothetical protein [Sphingosinicella sp. LHD-64]MDQ8756018.1 hypothetical protein [Sphingosinicella sp. LHD-64]